MCCRCDDVVHGEVYEGLDGWAGCVEVVAESKVVMVMLFCCHGYDEESVVLLLLMFYVVEELVVALVSIWFVVGHFVVKATIGNYVLGCVSLCVCVTCMLYVLCMFV